jgi:multidrug efflux pump subunit AcrB
LIVTGIASLFLRPFGLTISACLIVSLILSLTIVPLLFSRIGSETVEKKEFLGSYILTRFSFLLEKALRFCFRHKAIPISSGIILLLFSVLVAFLGKASLLPPIDEGAILIEYIMPPGTSLKESDRIGTILEKIAISNPDVSCVYRRTGSPEAGYQVEGVNRGELLIKLKPKSKRFHSLDEIMDWFRKRYSKIKGCVFLYHQPTREKIDEAFSGLPSLFGVTIYGPDIKMLTAIAKKVEKVLYSDQAVSNVINNTKIKAPEIEIRLRYPKLALYGLRPKDVFDIIKAMHLGIQVSNIIRQRQKISIIVKLDPGIKTDIDSIKMFPIACSDGGFVRLKDIADIKIHFSIPFITRINGEREVTLIAEVEGNIPKVAKRLERKFEAIHLPEGYSIEIGGQYQILIKTGLEMLISLICATVWIYLIMVMQFGSWAKPIIILFTVPIAIVGGIIGLFISGQGLDLSVGMGVVTLAGVAVNNAIVLIDYTNRQEKAGKAVENALILAASIRLRPILLTTFTTIAALLPVAVGTTVGSQIFKPFAITVIGGLITSTFATLIFIPTLYVIIKKG